MYDASTDTSKNYETFMEMIEDLNMTPQEVLDYLVNWHGLQLLSEDFIQNMIDCEI